MDHLINKLGRNVGLNMLIHRSSGFTEVLDLSSPQNFFRQIFMPLPLGAGGIMFQGSPSIHWKPEIPPFHLYMGPLVHPINRGRFAACPSNLLQRFPGICRRTHWGNGLQFCMLMYLDHLLSWLNYIYRLLIFLLLAPLSLSETGQI